MRPWLDIPTHKLYYISISELCTDVIDTSMQYFFFCKVLAKILFQVNDEFNEFFPITF